MAARKSRRTARSRQGTRRPKRDPEARDRALQALALMRSEGLSLTQASNKTEPRTTPATVRKYVGSVLQRDARGRYSPKPSDRLTREMRFMTPDGMIEIKFRSSRAATRIAEHAVAVELFLRTGRADSLEVFSGKSVRGTDGVAHSFVTDTTVLERVANAGEISFDRIYPGRA